MPARRPPAAPPHRLLQPGELPPLRYRWDRIGAIAATVVLLMVWFHLHQAEASARHAQASAAVGHAVIAAQRSSAASATAAVVADAVTATRPASASGTATATLPASASGTATASATTTTLATASTTGTATTTASASTPATGGCGYGSLKQNLHQNLASGSAKTVALTFDDGPSDYTTSVLGILADQDIHATFFIIGSQAQARPDLVKTEAQQGQLIGNHSWTHRTPSTAIGWPLSAATSEVDRTNNLLTELTGRQPCLFRPPGGVVKGIGPQARSRGMAITLWSVDSQDWRFEKHDAQATATQEIVRAALAGLTQKHPIVLMHDGGGDRSATVAALPQIISAYRAAGYQFVTVG